jgi:hypothetical protein
MAPRLQRRSPSEDEPRAQVEGDDAARGQEDPEVVLNARSLAPARQEAASFFRGFA